MEGVAAVYTSQRATAYSASGTAKGASGRRLTYGTVAINPSIIPYGSLMYITSDDGKFVYGYAYAADTGTAMMTGHAFIDLYYETYDESVDNAVIPVTVYVLDDETAAKYKEQKLMQFWKLIPRLADKTQKQPLPFRAEAVAV